MRSQVLGNSTTHFSISSSWEILAFLVTTYNNKLFKMFRKSSGGVGGRRVYSLILHIRGCSTGQGMVFYLSSDRVYSFTQDCAKQGIQFRASLSFSLSPGGRYRYLLKTRCNIAHIALFAYSLFLFHAIFHEYIASVKSFCWNQRPNR